MKERAGEIQWGRASRLRDDLWPEPASKLPRASPARLLLGSTGGSPRVCVLESRPILQARPPLTRLCPSHISPAGRLRWNYVVIWTAFGLRSRTGFIFLSWGTHSYRGRCHDLPVRRTARSSMAATPNH